MVGIVLPVAAFMVPDGRFLVVEGYDISTLHAISYRGIDGQSVGKADTATQRGVKHHAECFVS